MAQVIITLALYIFDEPKQEAREQNQNQNPLRK